MSTGRHAMKRAAEKENKLLDDQEKRLAKEEAKKAQMERDTESQRIATMRARFGGQVPQGTGVNTSGETNTTTGTSGGGKNRTPSALTTNQSTQTDPMRQTIMSMMLGNDDGAM